MTSTDTPPPKMILPVISTCNFLIGVGAFVIIGVLEPLGAGLNVAPERAGILMTVYALAYAVLSPVLVSMTGHIGRRRVMTFGLSLFLISGILSAVATSLGMLGAARVLAAAGAGLFTPVGAAVVAGLYPPEQRARVLAAAMFGFSLAQVIGVPAGAWIAYTFGWRFAFWGVVVLNIPCIFLIWHFVPAGLKFQAVTFGDLRTTLKDGRMMFAIAFTGLFLGSIYVIFTYMAPLFSQSMGMGRDMISITLIVAGIGAVMGNILGGFMADRLGWYKTLIILCCAQMIIMPLYSHLPVGVPAFFALSVIWAMAGWSFMAGQQMRLIGLAGPKAPVVLALTAACIYIGAAIGSAIGSFVISTWSIDALGYAAAFCMIFALLNLVISARFPPNSYGPS
ncbi:MULTISPECIES: MFS transporter [Rhodobacterales]|uniref:MFS transporter n=1 Tax=Rhodobacterales TaxID=204455 RepID=UPI0032978DAA